MIDFLNPARIGIPKKPGSGGGPVPAYSIFDDFESYSVGTVLNGQPIEINRGSEVWAGDSPTYNYGLVGSRAFGNAAIKNGSKPAVFGAVDALPVGGMVNTESIEFEAVLSSSYYIDFYITGDAFGLFKPNRIHLFLRANFLTFDHYQGTSRLRRISAGISPSMSTGPAKLLINNITATTLDVHLFNDDGSLSKQWIGIACDNSYHTTRYLTMSISNSDNVGAVYSFGVKDK